MKKGFTEIVFLLDKSASMSGRTSDTIGGFNGFLKEQKEVEGEANITLVQFAGLGETVPYKTVNINEQEELTTETYRANGGSTAYLDALGKVINETGQRLHELRESQKPEKVVFVVMTDGLENASREFTREAIRSMIKHQEDKYSWQFVFMGANFDAVGEGQKFGINVMRAYSYNATSGGFAEAFGATSKNLRNYRSNLAVNMDFTEEDRKKQEQAK